MTARALSSILRVLACAGACMTAGCGTGGRIVDGTETGNPEIVACVKKMAAVTFAALDSNNSWRPVDFLQASPGALAKTSSQSIVKPAGPSTGLKKTLATTSDTLILSDTVEIIYDTIFVSDTLRVLDTMKINKVLFVSDTVVDTFLSTTGNDTLYTFIKRQVRDSVTVFDKVVVADTIVQPRKKVIIKLYQYREGTPIAFIRADSVLIADSKNMVDQQPLNVPAFVTSGAVNWGVASVSYDYATAAPNYALVNELRQDTMVIPGNKNNFSVVSSQSFMARSKILDGIVIELAQYNRLDSVLSVMRYNPQAIDSVESLSVAYSVDPGVNLNSGLDDVLMGIHQQMVFRLGPIGSMNLAIAPEASQKGLGLSGGNGPSVSILLQNTRSLHGIFEGKVDAVQGLTGSYEYSGQKYQVTCDRSLRAIVIRVTN